MKGYPTPIVNNDGIALIGESAVSIDDIRLDHLAGSGANGFVFSGQDLLLERQVAVKVWPPRLDRVRSVEDRIDQALAEARKIARLKTDLIASVYRAGRLANMWPYIVMEYVDGVPLKDVRESLNDASGYTDRMWFWREVSRGLDTAERERIYHGDLHGGNVLVRPFHATLIDFGTSALSGKQSSLRRHANMVHKFAQWLFPELKEYIPPLDIPNLVRPEYATIAVEHWVNASDELRKLDGLYPDITDKDLDLKLGYMARNCTTALIDINTSVAKWLTGKGIPRSSVQAYSLAASDEVAHLRNRPYPGPGLRSRPVPPW